MERGLEPGLEPVQARAPGRELEPEQVPEPGLELAREPAQVPHRLERAVRSWPA